MRAFFQAAGKTPVDRDVLNISFRGYDRAIEQRLTNNAGMPSGPAPLFVLICLRCLRMVFSVIQREDILLFDGGIDVMEESLVREVEVDPNVDSKCVAKAFAISTPPVKVAPLSFISVGILAFGTFKLLTKLQNSFGLVFKLLSTRCM